MDRERIHERLGCFGYFGFGGGWEMVRRKRRHRRNGRVPPGPQETYCNVCPRRRACWKRHRARAAELFPDLMEAWEAMSDAYEGDPDAMMGAWRELAEAAGTPNALPPDLAVNVGNIRDGAAVAAGRPPADRGPYTLTWPLTPLEAPT